MKAMSVCYRILFFSMLAGSLSAFSIFDMRFPVGLPFHLKVEPPPSCPENEIYKSCLGNCSNCEERGRCSITCDKKGCDCLPSFVRLTPEGPCEHVSMCPKAKCGDNEVFRACGPTCELCVNTRCQAVSCDYKCYCKSGYRRNENGICVPESKCPKTRCRYGEAMGKSGPKDEYCVHEDSYKSSNETQNVEKCYCLPQHKRNAMGYCIDETRCVYVKCLGVETFNKCIPKCNTTCSNYGDPDCEEDDECYPGCFCPPGYVMNDYRRCVPIESCNTEPTPSGATELNSTAEESDESSSTEPDIDFEETYKEAMKILLAARVGLHRSDISSASSTTDRTTAKSDTSADGSTTTSSSGSITGRSDATTRSSTASKSATSADGSTTTSSASSTTGRSDATSSSSTAANSTAISESSTAAKSTAISESSTTDKSITSIKSSAASSTDESSQSSTAGGSSLTSAPSRSFTKSTASAGSDRTTTNATSTSTTTSVSSGGTAAPSKFARTASTHFATSTASTDMLSTETTDNFEMTEEDQQQATSKGTTTVEPTTSYATTKPPKRRSKISAKSKAAAITRSESKTTTPDPDNWDNDF